MALAGFAIALVLSFPVHLFAQYVPRGLAILLSFLILLVVTALQLMAQKRWVHYTE